MALTAISGVATGDSPARSPVSLAPCPADHLLPHKDRIPFAHSLLFGRTTQGNVIITRMQLSG
jgi:hypothetical protein